MQHSMIQSEKGYYWNNQIKLNFEWVSKLAIPRKYFGFKPYENEKLELILQIGSNVSFRPNPGYRPPYVPIEKLLSQVIYKKYWKLKSWENEKSQCEGWFLSANFILNSFIWETFLWKRLQLNQTRIFYYYI